MTCRTKWGASGSCHLCGPWPFEWLESLEGLSDDTPKDLIGLDKYGPSEVRPKEYDWTKKESGPYDDASDLYVLPEWSDWTRRNLVLSSGHASDWMVRWICLLETLLIGWSEDLSCGAFFWLLLTSCFVNSYNHLRATRNDTRMRLLSATNTPFNLPLTSETEKTNVTFVTYSTRGGVLKLCTMPMMWLGKCVLVVLVVNIMIHSQILV